MGNKDNLYGNNISGLNSGINTVLGNQAKDQLVTELKRDQKFKSVKHYNQRIQQVRQDFDQKMQEDNNYPEMMNKMQMNGDTNNES